MVKQMVKVLLYVACFSLGFVPIFILDIILDHLGLPIFLFGLAYLCAFGLDFLLNLELFFSFFFKYRIPNISICLLLDSFSDNIDFLLYINNWPRTLLQIVCLGHERSFKRETIKFNVVEKIIDETEIKKCFQMQMYN